MEKWTEAAINELIHLWRCRNTATQIANTLTATYGHHYTRNAVLGKIWRLRDAGYKVAKRGSPLYNGTPMHPVYELKDFIS
jgi:hypothetical protein